MGDSMEMLGDRMEMLGELEGPGRKEHWSCPATSLCCKASPCDRCLQGTPNRQQKLPWGQSLKFL